MSMIRVPVVTLVRKIGGEPSEEGGTVRRNLSPCTTLRGGTVGCTTGYKVLDLPRDQKV